MGLGLGLDPGRQAELSSGRVGSSCRSRHARGAATVALDARSGLDARGGGTLADGGATEGGRSLAALAAALAAAKAAEVAAVMVAAEVAAVMVAAEVATAGMAVEVTEVPAAAARMPDTTLPTASVPESACSSQWQYSIQ